jgi:hypothetical protein
MPCCHVQVQRCSVLVAAGSVVPAYLVAAVHDKQAVTNCLAAAAAPLLC